MSMLRRACRTGALDLGDGDPGLRWPRLHGLSPEERADLWPRMIWLRYALAVAAILITGRIHSKGLDEQDEVDAQGYLSEYWTHD